MISDGGGLATMPKVTIEVWSSLSHLFGLDRRTRHVLDMEIDEGTTLAGVLEKLADENPRFAEVMYKPNSNEPSGHVSVVVNERLPELLDGYETKLNEGDRIILVQAYAGG